MNFNTFYYGQIFPSHFVIFWVYWVYLCLHLMLVKGRQHFLLAGTSEFIQVGIT